jgi:hypothetical protein
LPGESIQPIPLSERAKTAIETERSDQVGLIRKYMVELAESIASMAPTFAQNEPDLRDDQLLQAIDESTGVVLQFAQLAETIALMNATESARAMFKGFASILDLYTFPPEFQGPHYEFDHDLAKFLGHELFVIFFTLLIREERWELISDLLDEDLYARIRDFSPPSTTSFYHLSEHIRLLQLRKERLKSNRMSLHADLLARRHTQGELAKLIPLEEFAQADFFLFLRAQLQPETDPRWPLWAPWSLLYMKLPPRYLREAERVKYARQLLRPLGVTDIFVLQARLKERAGQIVGWWGNGFWHYALSGFDFDTIGSR